MTDHLFEGTQILTQLQCSGMIELRSKYTVFSFSQYTTNLHLNVIIVVTYNFCCIVWF